MPVLFLSCKPEINFDGENYSGKNDRALYEGWDVVENDEVAAAKEAAPKKDTKRTKVVAFEGILTNLSKIGAKKLTADMESDAGVAFIESTENLLSGLLKFTDGMLDNYTFGFYKTFEYGKSE